MARWSLSSSTGHHAARHVLSGRGAIGTITPLSGQIISVIVSLIAITTLSVFLTKRVFKVKCWKSLPFAILLVFAIYTDSYFFVFATAVLELSVGIDADIHTCDAAILLCLACYVTTKFIYLFLVEKAHIIRGCSKPRLHSKLYLFNSFGILGVYALVVILNFIFRITKIEEGQCIIGMKRAVMIPLISFDAVINMYLTVLFLVPLRRLYSFKEMPRTRANFRLKTAAFRTFCGAVCTLLSSIVNLSVLMALQGEPGWLCLLCCNCDVVFSSIVIQWVTSRDQPARSTTTSSSGSRTAGNMNPKQDVSPYNELQLTPPQTSASVSFLNVPHWSMGNHDNDSASLTTKVTNPNSVFIKTTIKCERAPSDGIFNAPSVIVTSKHRTSLEETQNAVKGGGMGLDGPGTSLTNSTETFKFQQKHARFSRLHEF